SIARWTHDRVLADVVRVIRIVRPLAITSVFVGGPSDGHGNHQTAGAMAQEAFKAAGDRNMFPEQIRAGLRPWTPVKDYARAPGFLRAALGEIQAAVEQASAKFSAARPEQAAPSLAAGLKRTIQLLDAVEKSGLAADAKYDVRHELEIKRAQFNNALAQALGL